MEESKEKNEMSKTKEVLRWLAILPAYVGGLFVGTIVVNVASYLNRWYTGASEDSGWALITYYIIAPAASAGLAVYWGSKVAPASKKIVSMVLAAIMIILQTISVFGNISNDTANPWWFIIGGIASIFAAGFIVYSFFTDGEEFNLFKEE